MLTTQDVIRGRLPFSSRPVVAGLLGIAGLVCSTAEVAHAKPDLPSLVDGFEFVDAGIKVTIDLDEVRAVVRAELPRLAKTLPVRGLRLAYDSLEFHVARTGGEVEFTLRASAYKRSERLAQVQVRGRLALRVTRAQKLNSTVLLDSMRVKLNGVSVNIKQRGTRVYRRESELPTFGFSDIQFTEIRFLNSGARTAAAELVVAP